MAFGGPNLVKIKVLEVLRCKKHGNHLKMYENLQIIEILSSLIPRWLVISQDVCLFIDVNLAVNLCSNRSGQ